MDTPASSEAEILAQASAKSADGPPAELEGSEPIQESGSPQILPFDFRNPAFLSAKDMRMLRVEHEVLTQGLAARLSIYLRMEFGLRLSTIENVAYRNFVESLPTPCQLTLFKAEPLRGIGILGMSPKLGLAMIDRLMGGPGQAPAEPRDLTEIETALLDQAQQLILGEWCNHWAKLKELHPAVLGHENTARFLQTSQPETVTLVVTMEGRIGECIEPVQLAFPYSTIEPLIEGMERKLQPAGEQAAGASLTSPKPKWNHYFDDLKIPVAAQWSGLTLTARELTKLRVGEVIPLPAEFSERVQLSLAKAPRFRGRLGSANGRWAVELVEAI
jgi:flagellar motor switch protein FliM